MKNPIARLGILFVVASCVRTPPSSDVGDVKSSVTAGTPSPPVSSTGKPPPVLSLEEDSQSLSVKPLDEAGARAARAVYSGDGKYTLELAGTYDERYLVRAATSGRVVIKGSGWYARWVSDSEVAFLDDARRLAKRDASDPSKTTEGSRACGGWLSCQPDSAPPRLLWVSRDLELAVVRGTGDEPFLVRKGEITSLELAASEEPSGKMMALGIGTRGTLCTLARPGHEDAGAQPSTGRLRCAPPAWTAWRRVRDFAVEGPLERPNRDAHAEFMSESEVLLSLRPANPDPRKFVHCVVALETTAARCTSAARPAWHSVRDGRWVVEEPDIGISLPRLIDLERRRSWALGDDRRAVYSHPVPDARKVGRIVLERLDKAEFRAGTVDLPAAP